MKKSISKMLAVMLLLSMTLTACRSGAAAPAPAAATTAPSDGAQDAAPVQEDYKIGIITGTVSQGEEEFRAAENMKKIYGDKIVTATYPDKFNDEMETTISNTLGLASDPAVKAIIFVQAVPGTSASIDKVRETRPDMLFIVGVPGEDPEIIASKADIVLQSDELAMGTTIMEQAKKMGAETFVHYSFPRHMSYALLSARRDLLRENAAKLGIEFVEATAPDPTGDAGVAGAQQFILEDVPRKVAEYGTKTAFFNTNCSMQEPLIKAVLEEGALYPQQCCPSPYHGYPGALGIKIPEDKQGDVDYVISEISSIINEKGAKGRFSTWPIPISMLMIESGVEYAIAFCEGQTSGRVDKTKLVDIMESVADGGMTVATYDEDGVKLDNFFMLLSDYITF